MIQADESQCKKSIIVISALRDASNAALARHDLLAYAAMMANDYIVLPGSYGRPVDKQKICDALRRDFSSGDLTLIVRSPEQIQISFNGRRAAERGSWVTLRRKQDGEMCVEGMYQATWINGEEGWSLLNESFVTLSCSGSAACMDM